MKQKRETKGQSSHQMQCPDCGGWFDMRDLAAVFAHQHWMAKTPAAVSYSHAQQEGNSKEFFIKTDEGIKTLRYGNRQNGYPEHRA